MRLLTVGVLSATLLLAAPQSPVARIGEVDALAAFARLYGVVRYFYPSDTAAELDWDRFAVYGVSQVRGARDRDALIDVTARLFTALGPGIEVGATLGPPPAIGPRDASLVAWRYLGAGVSAAPPPGQIYRAERTNRARADALPRGMPTRSIEAFETYVPEAGVHADVDLGAGLRARVPLALSQEQAASRPGAERLAILQAVAARPPSDNGSDLDTRLADVIVAWNVFRHFYPYWTEVNALTRSDWDTELQPQLWRTLDSTPAAHRDVLAGLVAAIHDGHGRVVRQGETPAGRVPLQLRRLEGKVAITASAVAELPIGTVITRIDDVPVDQRLADLKQLVSGTEQWKEWRALQSVTMCERGAAVLLSVESAGGARTVPLVCGTAPVPREKRPSPVSEVSVGVWYVDLTRAKWDEVRTALPQIAEARGVVFDVRGYPTDAGIGLLPHLLGSAESDRWMHVGIVTGPFGRVAATHSIGWNLSPARPVVTGKRVFLTDGSAISYAESVMGYVADRLLGTIIGAPTAGANGNVATFTVPSGLTIGFTGMRVTRHDGRSQHHLMGVQPHIAMTRTLAGLTDGRDELLDRAVALILKP